MNYAELMVEVGLGEDSSRQFKVDIRNAESLSAEMAAFANSNGGIILIGVADNGDVPGLSKEDVGRINQLISNAASQLVRSPLTVETNNVALGNGGLVICLRVPAGLDKPYFDRKGVIWLKSGADKRRVNSKEELRRLFQVTGQFHADELPTKAGLAQLDKLRFSMFLEQVYELPYPETEEALSVLLQNLGLASDESHLNLAGVLLFARHPEWIKPQFVVKAVRFPGNDIHPAVYEDTEEYAGVLSQMYEGTLGFIMRNMHKVQAGNGVNSPGTSEVPRIVFEELLVNALVHRDYLIDAPVRVFIFDNRVEIISPGHLPNNLTVDKIRSGNANSRNPVLLSYAAKGVLPYHGLGSGIRRALKVYPEIDFEDDREGALFKATVWRNVRVK